MMSNKDVTGRSLLVHGFSRVATKCPNYHSDTEFYHTQLCYDQGAQVWRDMVGGDTEAVLSPAPMQYNEIVKASAFKFNLGVK